MVDTDFDIVVVGGGHAGVEAAWAAARLGRRVALVTLSPRTVGQMSCNPAIGGVGKGQLVREIDAMGGLMGLAADATGIQFRMLNRSKGPAVWGPRCQSDRHAYAAWVQRALARLDNLTILAAEASEIRTEAGRVVALRVRLREDAETAEGGTIDDELARCRREDQWRRGADAVDLTCRAVIVAAGTFLNGRMHLGQTTWHGGRYGEDRSAGLSDSLRTLGVRLGRLKTGTCPRLAAESIDYGQCTRQDGDAEPAAFSFLADDLAVRQVPCWITHTTPEIHDLVRAALHRAPLYTGQIQSAGPRYCPSFETKVVRFGEKASHMIFLEPEGRSTNWVYANGISTSLPIDVQAAMVRAVGGLRNAHVLRWGYAIEYDFAPPTQLKATLETKAVGGLFLAGQINGTTGYEEAAAQGLIAALNAAAALAGGEQLVLGRDEAYIGVMIDDLVTKGVTEPYRVFTSRAEHRLTLRADNADRRLTPIGRRVGLVDDARWRRYGRAREACDRARELLGSQRIDGTRMWDLLRRPQVSLASLRASAEPGVGQELGELIARCPRAVASLAVDGRYAGYVEKEQTALKQMQELDKKLLPDDVDYSAIGHLRHEAREKLADVRPRSLGQALRISGVTPADITVLAVFLAGAGRSQGAARRLNDA